jgi:flagellar motor switch protein FliG
MADRRNSELDREAMLRRIAIVLSSLPAPVAAQLLGSIDPQTKQAVRRTMTSLADVDPLERRRALRAFKVSVEKRPEVRNPETDPVRDNNAIEDEVAVTASAETSHVASRVVSSTVSVTRPAEDSLPLSFLGDVQDDILVSLLAIEHPQAVALVLASIAPAQAARVLPRLDPKIQADALSRIGRLGNIPEAAVAEIAEHFRHRLARRTGDGRNATGQRALDAILAAMPTPVSSPAPLHHSVASVTPQAVQTPQNSSQPPIAAATFPSADVPAIDLALKMRVAEHTLPEANAAVDRETESTADPQGASQSSGQTQTEENLSADNGISDAQLSKSALTDSPLAFKSTDAINQRLLNLPPTQLCQALGKVGTRDAMLALCGLPNQVADSVLAILPRAHAKQVRTQMVTLNTLQLREIDEAKEKVALASLETSGQATQQVPVAA